jgi:hypothetical protein
MKLSNAGTLRLPGTKIAFDLHEFHNGSFGAKRSSREASDQAKAVAARLILVVDETATEMSDQQLLLSFESIRKGPRFSSHA